MRKDTEVSRRGFFAALPAAWLAAKRWATGVQVTPEEVAPVSAPIAIDPKGLSNPTTIASTATYSELEFATWLEYKDGEPYQTWMRWSDGRWRTIPLGNPQ